MPMPMPIPLLVPSHCHQRRIWFPRPRTLLRCVDLVQPSVILLEKPCTCCQDRSRPRLHVSTVRGARSLRANIKQVRVVQRISASADVRSQLTCASMFLLSARARVQCPNTNTLKCGAMHCVFPTLYRRKRTCTTLAPHTVVAALAERKPTDWYVQTPKLQQC